MTAQDWITLAGVIIGGGSIGTAALKLHQLAVAVEKIAAGVAAATAAARPSSAGTASRPPAAPGP